MAAVLYQDEQCEQEGLVVHTAPVMQLDNEQLFQFCQINRDLRIERAADGDIVIMAPAGGSSSRGNASLVTAFMNWAEAEGTGGVFDSSAGFLLPNGAMRSPDVSWVRRERLTTLTDEQWERFLPLCPDFVLELRSTTDSLRVLKGKMEEYIRNGARLGWLIDPKAKQVHLYRPDEKPEILDNPSVLKGEPVLPGFVLVLSELWAAMERRR
jgi:Uma2 family endonuclease